MPPVFQQKWKLFTETRKQYKRSGTIRKTRSSATAEKHRVSCACLHELANWSCNAQNTAESQRL